MQQWGYLLGLYGEKFGKEGESCTFVWSLWVCTRQQSLITVDPGNIVVLRNTGLIKKPPPRNKQA